MKIYVTSAGRGNRHQRQMSFKVKWKQVTTKNGFTYWKFKKGALFIWEE